MTDTSIRLTVFILILTAMLVWEKSSAFISTQPRFTKRWFNNVGISVLNSIALSLLGPLSALAVAHWAISHKVGLFNFLDVPAYLSMILSIIFLDLAIYTQHLAAHRFNWFWRIHRMHHADPFFDVTTAIRFHPLEILLSAFIKMTIIVFIGAPVIAVLTFEIILSAMALFNHGNISLPKKIEPAVRWFFVTPDMHRIHHSQLKSEHHSNFGFNLSIWDRIFKTYTKQFRDDNFSIGLSEFHDKKENSTMVGMLTMPFKATPKN